MKLEDHIEQIRSDIACHRYTTATKDSAAIIEFAFREIFRRSIGEVGGSTRRKVLEAERKIGRPDRGIESFTLGQVVQLFQESQLFEAYTKATGVQLRAITMIDFDEVVALRNRLQHDLYDANRGEAQLFLQCAENMLEAFGILTLDAEETQSEKEPARQTETVRGPSKDMARSSSYFPHTTKEVSRVAMQAAFHRQLDIRMFAFAINDLVSPLIGLDVGCGWGEVTVDRFGSYEQFVQVVGIDKDVECIRKALSMYGADEHCAFVLLDVEGASAGDEVQQLLAEHDDVPVVAFLAMVLHHLAAPIRVLKMLRSVLPAGSKLVIRTFDDGSKIDYPSEDGRLQEIIDLTRQAPGESDRFHGRKLFHELYRAGFRDIRLFAEPILLGNLSETERRTLYTAHFSHRTDCWDQAQESVELGASEMHQLEALRESLDEYAMDLEDPSFFFYESLFGAVATVN